MRKGIWDQIEKLRGSEQGVDGELQQRCARLEQRAKCCAEAYQEMAPEVKTMRELLLSYQKERSERLEQQVRASDEERKQLLGEIQRLRDRLASVEMRKAADVKKASFRREN
jgi:hypothetical protein